VEEGREPEEDTSPRGFLQFLIVLERVDELLKGQPDYDAWWAEYGPKLAVRIEAREERRRQREAIEGFIEQEFRDFFKFPKN